MTKLIKCKLITDDVMDDILRNPFNPPSINSPVSEEGFRQEYWENHSAIRTSLERIGEYNSSGEADFCMNEDWSLTRGIAIILTSRRLITSGLIPVIQDSMARMVEKYSVHINHDLLDLDEFDILIQNADVWCCCHNLDLIQRLGLDPVK